MIRKDIEDNKKQVLMMISLKESKAKICKYLQCKPLTLDNYLKKWNVVYKGNQGLKNKKVSNKRINAIDYSKKDIVKVTSLRKKLIEDGIKKDECEVCGHTHWQNKKLTLELHHKDGNRYNNLIDNLQILCPNCHSLISNHARIKTIKIKKMSYCSCGKQILVGSEMCEECWHKKNRKVTNRPEKSILLEDVKNLGYSGSGRKYGVSDNTIRKWLKL